MSAENVTAAVVPVPDGTTAERPSRRHRATGLLLASPPLLLVALFVGFPIVVAVAYSLGHTGGLNATVSVIAKEQVTVSSWWQQSLGAYSSLFADERFRRDLLVTVLVSLGVTVLVLVLAWVIALYVRLSDSWVSRVLSALAVVPMFVPVVIASWAILTFYAADGFLRSVAATMGLTAPVWGYTTTAVVIGLTWTSLPFATLMVVSGVQGVPDALIEAARDAGASLPRVVLSVIAPMALVPTVIAGTFTAIGTLGSFTVPYFTGPNAPKMLGVDMSDYFTSYNLPQASVAMAVVVFVVAAGFGAVYVWANYRSAASTGRV
ncbi:ABC transporter permease [Lapillicoccus jejuensis]|uniref:Carbohydrate ABC transporter membrane protein 1 (CUT1 family) n=1 Tax=Lapillicoccus jejuensis TaxID=402171 RepID=A0A542E1K3_9MICO|nr:ABC transporter permease subunit [Lapillicoccus jejuensis]TQJ09212.1 carbohydrate ABC transporter membrane protein 1 (CUT1 family) [Lapillicoccus jejuensis]